MSTAKPTQSNHATASTGELASGDPGPHGAAADLTAFLQSLLEFQSRLVDAIGGAAFLVESPTRRGGVAALFVSDSPDAALLRAALAPEGKVRAVVERVGKEVASKGDQSGEVVPIRLGDSALYDASPTHRLLACPIIAAGQTEGAFVLVQSIQSELSTEETLSRLALTSARLESFLWQQRAMTETEQRIRLRETLELLDASQQGANADAMGALMCHELQRRFGCSRVSIGLIRGDQIRLAALSGADNVDRKGPAVESIEAAMDECADQDTEVIFPSPPETEHDPAQRRVTRAHGKLSEKFGPSSVLSLPLRVEGDLVGVVVLERPADDPFPPGSATLLRLVAEFIGPALWTRRMADRGVLAVTRDRTLDLCRAIVGPRHTGKKLLGMAAAIALIVGSVPWMPMRVSASAQIKAAQSRTIVPPFDGHLEEVYVRPGDKVSEGDVLASLDTTELSLESTRLRLEQANAMTERDAATREGNQAQAEVYAGQIAELGQRLEVIAYRLENAQIRAPFTGTVGQGDLEALVGAQVDPGKPLFVLVGSENIAAIEIDERDIGDVRVGQGGFLALKGSPSEKIPVRVSHISPVAEPIERANVYMIEAEFAALPEGLVMSPGMSASVKLDVVREGKLVRHSPVDVLLGPIIDDLRMRLWF
jgi:biotin carboxyl carrier protein